MPSASEVLKALKPVAWRLGRLRRAVADVGTARVFSGQFDWPADPFFRPVVGAFVNGTLSAVAPTRRVKPPASSPAGTAWPCVFRLRVAGAPGTVVVRCLESGATVAADPAASTVAQSGVLDVKALMARAEVALRSADLDGFPAFLAIPAAEQIDLLHQSVLGRSPDDTAAADLRSMLNDGRTILDIRDQLLQSEEFHTRRLRAVAPPFGHWPVWSGLQDVVGGLASLWPVGEKAEPPQDARDLARLALGNAGPGVAAAWTAQHADAVADVVRRRAALRPPRDARTQARGALSLGHFLDGMRVGQAGVRTTAGVTIDPAVKGDVLFGPYIALADGDYRLVVKFGPMNGSARLALEVVSGELLFAAKAIDPGAAGRCTVDFVVPRGSAAIRSAKFEFRLRTGGGMSGTVTDVALVRLGRAEPEASLVQESMNLLPILSVGPAGALSAEGIESSAAQTGAIFFGPNRALSPGRHVVTLTLVRAPKSEDAPGGVLLEIVARKRTLAQLRVDPATGVSTIALPFAVDPAFAHEPVEFRLSKVSELALMVTAVDLRADDGVP